jgi:hypothetical protein
VEFIGQITGEQNMFLQLTSKDAVMFVYKKTIFEIHNDYRKSLPDNSQCHGYIYETFHILDIYCQIIKTLVSQFINENELICITANKTYIEELTKIDKTGEIINNPTPKINSIQLEKIKLVIDCFSEVKEKYYDTIQTFVIKFFKSKTIQEIPEHICKEKISKFILAQPINTNIDSFINYILS